VVLNSLTSPGMVGGGLAVLKPGGRWVEIGKRDIWSRAAVSVERPDVGYSLVAVDFLPDGVVQECLLGVAAGAAAGRLRPLPLVGYGLGQVVAALRQMSQARHVGKVVVHAPPATFFRDPAAAANTGVVVITGGLGALGQLLCSWLVQAGVCHVVLLGRTAKLGVSQQQHLHSAMGSDTTCVTVLQADSSSRADVAGVLAAVCDEQPLLAVLHAGGVLRDGLMQQQSLSAAKQVFAPKPVALQAWLDVAALQPVSQQVLFSSVAALLGSPGQSNYAAANAALDAAAGALQGAGLGVVSVQWGAWAGAGMAAADASTAARVARSGMALLQPAQGLAALEAVLNSTRSAVPGSPHAPVHAAVPFMWDKFLQHVRGNTPKVFADVAGTLPAAAAASAATASAGRQLPSASLSAPRQQRVQEVEQQVQATIRSITGQEVRLHAYCSVLMHEVFYRLADLYAATTAGH
jgi:short-subunit dehydrogenase